MERNFQKVPYLEPPECFISAGGFCSFFNDVTLKENYFEAKDGLSTKIERLLGCNRVPDSV